jgi:hypothetical protein
MSIVYLSFCYIFISRKVKFDKKPEYETKALLEAEENEFFSVDPNRSKAKLEGEDVM